MTELAAPENNDKAESEKLGAAKTVAGVIVSTSVRFVIASSISSLVPTETKSQKIRVAIGSYVISGLIADKAKSYIRDDIDEKIEFYREVMSYIRKNKDELNGTPNQ